jgi:hypothetical protein
MEKAIVKPRIRVGRTEMDFPHQGKILTAMHPFYGPAKSLNLLSKIKGSPENPTGCVEPTSAQLTSFVHEYFNGKESQAKEVNQIMKGGYFKGFTGILYLPQKQIVHFIDHPAFDKYSVVSRDNLLKRLTESRAQVPFKHLKESTVDWRKVAKHPYFVAWAGGEGAEKLAELTSKYSMQEAYIWVPDVSDLKEPIARIAILCSGYDHSRLKISSTNHGNGGGGCAFGVQKIK